MLNVIILSAVMPIAESLIFSIVMRRVIILSVVRLNVAFLNVALLKVVMLIVLILNVAMLNVVMLSVMAAFCKRRHRLCRCLKRRWHLHRNNAMCPTLSKKGLSGYGYMPIAAIYMCDKLFTNSPKYSQNSQKIFRLLRVMRKYTISRLSYAHY